jgi:arylsulfatase
MEKNIHKLYFMVIGSFTLLINLSCVAQKNIDIKKMPKPNIIYILADDLGYGELGVYGQNKIETPHLDALAQSGMKFTQHYTSAPVCAPARYMLLTGKHSGHAYIRGNDEWSDRGDVWNYRSTLEDMTLEGQRPMPQGTKILPMYLKEVGYTTGMVGKWGLGAPHTHSIPSKMGFDYFYGYNCQRQAHTYYPVHLYENEKRVLLGNDTLSPAVKLDKDADPADANSYTKFTLQKYAPDLMYEKMITFIEENKTKPFFLYWATPIPHNPIQAPKKWVDHYVKKFGKEIPYLADKGYYPHQNPRAGYAAMISYLDEQIGELVAYLKENKLYENTLILFSSDNGVTFTGGTDGIFFNSSGPFDEEYGKGKGFLYEGGIRVPMIASWPKVIKKASISDHISTHYDILATLSEVAGFKVQSTDGISFLPTLLGKKQKQKHNFLYWEFPEYGGQVAIRLGDWKVVRQNLKDKNKVPTLELYNLKTDINEKVNLAKKHPDILAKAAKIFSREHQDAEIERFRIPAIEDALY